MPSFCEWTAEKVPKDPDLEQQPKSSLMAWLASRSRYRLSPPRRDHRHPQRERADAMADLEQPKELL